MNSNIDTIYKLYVNDRNYLKWSLCETANFQPISIENFNPAEEKLFSNDVFCVNYNTNNSKNNINLIHSSIRTASSMPGVLMIEGNKTFGRKNGKLLYKCVPDDMRIPTFLVPYEIKNVGFSKVFVNLYVTFSFVDWSDKHPHGILTNVIGPVDELDNFYEYQLHCKSLNASIQKFQKDTAHALKNASHDEFIESIKKKYDSIVDRTNQKEWNIFTIDPQNSCDFDDGFSIKDIDEVTQQLSIYISNVTIWMDVLNLWDSFSQRISTIYLPDRKRPMLPTILSDCLCSLQEKSTRIAFTMDIIIRDGKIIDTKYSNCLIRVFKNYTYEQKELIENPNFIKLLETTKLLAKEYKYINNVRNSHEVVCYLMILMNYNCAREMIKFKTGVFRSTIMKREVSIPDSVPDDVGKFIKIWNSACGQYIDISKEGEVITRHELLDMDAYIHITSPIRRLVDLLNIIKFQKLMNLVELSSNVDSFYEKWVSNLEYINVTMRSIRKVQIDCSLLDLCAKHPDIMDKEYSGFLFDKLVRNDGLYQFIVFLPELKLASRITLRDNFENFDTKKFKLYLFNDEDSFKKKIRLHLL